LNGRLAGPTSRRATDQPEDFIDEQVFRYNEREDNDRERFVKVLKATDGRRQTYKALIGRP
jgi:hypothetical protein